uniref:Putative squalene/phytoene synthase n=1 Tax=Magnetococcus massalia (strain MO-1) TaxID=451514 RepID=A0A1S7LLN8_MAGMO|nr:putative squalene/phytoene synthase [Candidatus Magnetococcus massalia]
MTPHQYCQDRVRRSGSSFYWPMKLLSGTQRQGLFALYAFCREVDDIVDRDLDPRAAQLKLLWWRQEIDEIFSGQPRHPVARALKELQPHFQWQPAPFLAILDGMVMDLQPQLYPTMVELTDYCAKVSVAVGLAALKVFGAEGESAERYAHHLGMALQLTNIIRDVAEDAQRGRIYLPEDLLTRHGVAREEILQGDRPPALTQAMIELSSLAEEHFTQASQLVDGPLYGKLLAARAMGAVYHARLRRLITLEFPQDKQQAGISRWHKIRLCLRCWLATRLSWLRQYDAR